MVWVIAVFFQKRSKFLGSPSSAPLASWPSTSIHRSYFTSHFLRRYSKCGSDCIQRRPPNSVEYTRFDPLPSQTLCIYSLGSSPLECLAHSPSSKLRAFFTSLAVVLLASGFGGSLGSSCVSPRSQRELRSPGRWLLPFFGFQPLNRCYKISAVPTVSFGVCSSSSNSSFFQHGSNCGSNCVSRRPQISVAPHRLALLHSLLTLVFGASKKLFSGATSSVTSGFMVCRCSRR